MTSLSLTDEQQAVVRHDTGPALVFAVAGAGKTTAMVHRVERLVREKIFAPQRILATSFGKATVTEIGRRLQAWPHCAAVRPMTLHGLSWRVLKELQRRGEFAARWQLPGGEENSRGLYYRALRLARQRGDCGDLDAIEPEDFLDWVGSCKARLEYADLAAADLPPAALEQASQAKPPRNLPDYLSLYRLFEEVRQQAGLLSFDDLLLTCWELFLRRPERLADWRGRFDCLLVDEFQDLNRVQSELLDLLARGHSNYMAIGDDDQTIYQWRGASPDFILGFEDRYAARRYLLTDNFRSRPAALVLANAVIGQNSHRQPKSLHPTRAFGGLTRLHPVKDTPGQAGVLTRVVAAELANGRPPREIAVLVRTYAQTPFLERQLIEAGIAYQLPDGRRFYQRPEIRDLLSYVALARFDAELEAGAGWSVERLEAWQSHWQRIRNRPTRYFSQALSQDLVGLMQSRQIGLADALRTFAGRCEAYLAERMDKLADILDGLRRAWGSGESAHAALTALENRLGWCQWLEAATSAHGHERAENVRAFLAFSRELGSLAELRTALQELARRQAEQAGAEAITLTSVHRAKGLEWPLVFVPGCSDGVYPAETEADGEAECRLLYVALTRSREQLHLFMPADAPPSPYLRRADAEGLLRRLEQLEALLALPDWDWTQLRRFFQLLAPLGLERSFRRWFRLAPERLRQIRGTLALLQARGLWHACRLDPALGSLWPPAADSLTEAETAAMLAVFCPPEGPLEPHQIRHARYGVGEVLKQISGQRQEMLLIRFPGKGKMQLPRHDAELSR